MSNKTKTTKAEENKQASKIAPAVAKKEDVVNSRPFDQNEIVEDLKSIIVELNGEIAPIKEVTKTVETVKVQAVESKQEVKEEKKLPILTIVLGILCLILAVLLFIKPSSKTGPIKLNGIVNGFEDTEMSLTLPSNFFLADDGTIQLLEDGILKTKGMIDGMKSSQEDYDTAAEYYKSLLGAEEIEVNGNKVLKITQENEGQILSYYLSFKDGVLSEIILDTLDDELALQIVGGLK